MQTPINITALVDVIGALADRTLENHLFLMDTVRDSRDQGSAGLTTVCRRGDLIRWKLIQVDVQSPAELRSLAFLDVRSQFEAPGFGPCPLPGNAPRLYPEPPTGFEPVIPGHFVWSGIIPFEWVPGQYRYRMELQFGSGEQSVLTSTMASLDVVG